MCVAGVFVRAQANVRICVCSAIKPGHGARSRGGPRPTEWRIAEEAACFRQEDDGIHCSGIRAGWAPEPVLTEGT